MGDMSMMRDEEDGYGRRDKGIQVDEEREN